MFRKFQARSAKSGKMGRVDGSRAVGFFLLAIRDDFGNFPNGPFSQNVATTRESNQIKSNQIYQPAQKNMYPRNASEMVFENFLFKGHLPPPKKTSKLKGSNGRLSQTSLEPMRRAADRCCSLHVVVQGSGSFPTPVNVRLRTSQELRSVKVPICRIFAYFPTQNA